MKKWQSHLLALGLCLGLSSAAWSQAKVVQSGAVTASGNQVLLNNTNGAVNVAVEELVTGAPTTVTITIQGCMRGGTCDAAADTNTTVGASIRKPAFTAVYDYFLVTAKWTGGSSVEVDVNATLSMSRLNVNANVFQGILALANGGLGVDASSVAAHLYFGNGTGGSAAPAFTRPACADLSNSAASCSVDTTVAGNIGTGTLSAGRLPAFTGDTTSSAGSAATTTKQIHYTVTNVTSGSSPYTVAAGDSVITCDASGGAVTINLPAATGGGRIIQIKKTDSSANACTPTRAGGDTIDGATSYSLTKQYAASAEVDVASGSWSRTHVNQVAGDTSGTTTAMTVDKVSGQKRRLLYFVSAQYTPAAPAAAVVGTTGTSYTYKYVILDTYGNVAAISAGATVSAAATLNGSNHVQVTCPATFGVYDGTTATCTVYRSASAGTPATVGALTGCTSLALGAVCDDTGKVGDTTVAGIFTGTAADQTLFSYTVPGGTLTASGCLRVTVAFNHSTGTAGAIYKISLGGTQFTNTSNATNATTGLLVTSGIVCNYNGSTSVNVGGAVSSLGGTSYGTGAVSTASDQAVVFSDNVANTDKITIYNFTVEAL